MTPTPDGPFLIDPNANFAGLRAALSRAGYTREAIQAARAMPIDRVFDMATAMNLTTGDTGALIRLFMLGRSIERSTLLRLIPASLVQALERTGLVVSAGDSVRAIAALAPMYGTLVVRDFEHFITNKPLAPDHVLGTGLATTVLSKLTPRILTRGPRPRRALDLGTGQGFQAIIAAEHVDEVIGTDINPRALNFARLGAQLNCVKPPNFMLGGFFEPVADDLADPARPGSGFDLIVCNPPFVISPPHDVVCMGGSESGDRMVEHVVRGSIPRLREDGYAVFIGNWFHGGAADWPDKPRGWVEDSGCDRWIIRFSTQDPESYARSWIDEGSLALAPGQKEAELEKWLAYYDTIGAGAISFGAIILHRRAGSDHWCREDSLPLEGLHDQAGDQVQRIFRNTTLVRQTPDTTRLLDLPLALNPDHELEQHCKLQTKGSESGWAPLRASLSQTRGFAMTVSVDPLVMRVLQGWDGRRPGSAIIREIAAEMGARPDDALLQSGKVAARMLLQGHLTVNS